MGMRAWLVKQGQRLDFPGRPVVKNSPHNAGDLGSIPGQRTRIPEQRELCTTDQRDLCTATSGPHTTTRESELQLKIPHDAMKIPHSK